MLTPNQVKQLKRIQDPLVKRRYTIYFQLPESVRRLFFDEKSSKQMNEIGQKNGLDETQTRQASYVTGLVLLGETNIIDFVKTIKEMCRLDNEKARQLARDINSVVFLPVKDSLKIIHHISDWPREEESGQTARPEDNKRIVSLKKKLPPQPPVNANNIVNLKEK